MKKSLTVFIQALIFFVVFAAGSFIAPFHLHWGTTITESSTTTIPARDSTAPPTTVIQSHTIRYFVPDGLLLALGLLIAIVLFQVLRKRTGNTTLDSCCLHACDRCGLLYETRLHHTRSQLGFAPLMSETPSSSSQSFFLHFLQVEAH